MTDQKKDFITECFINLAKFDFRKQFLVWFKNNKLDNTTEIGKEKALEVDEGIEQTDQMTNSLIDFITNGDPKALENFDKEKKSKKSKAVKKQFEDETSLIEVAPLPGERNIAIEERGSL